MNEQQINQILDNLKIGADPEVFLFKGEAPVSAVGLVPGTKANPFKVANGAVQLDGMAAEFNIDPATSAEEFNNNIQSVLDTLKSMVGDHNLNAIPTAHFGRELIMAQPDSARDLGCEPDYNAYTGKENPRPNVDAPFRTGAGHVHIGWTEGANPFSPQHFNDCRVLAAQLDSALGIPSLAFDTDTIRREMYGDWGAFRPKPYGMEYRVLSNSWLKNPELIKWVFDTTKVAFKNLLIKGETILHNPRGAIKDIQRGWGDFNHVMDILSERGGITVPPAVGEDIYVR